MALTKAEMADRLFEEVGLNKREAKEFVDMFFDTLRGALESGRQVKLSGFGNFVFRTAPCIFCIGLGSQKLVSQIRTFCLQSG